MAKKTTTKDGRHFNKGRPLLTEPNARDKAILEALRDGHTMAEVGRVYELSRQYIFQIRERWPEYAPNKKHLLKRLIKSAKSNLIHTN